eukprot:7106319-Alexandrium_andersonii.AAC.1
MRSSGHAQRVIQLACARRSGHAQRSRRPAPLQRLGHETRAPGPWADAAAFCRLGVFGCGCPR